MADSSSSLTPEKRLLNLIESGGKGEAASEPKARPVVTQTSTANTASLKSLTTVSVVEKAQLFFEDFKKRFGIKTVNSGARVVLVGLALVTIVNAAYEMKVAGRDPLFGLDVPERKITRIDVDETVIDAGKMQGQDSRNVFLPFAKREELLAAKPDASSSSAKLVEMTKTMKLTGISYNPEDATGTYCMIEDLQKNITVFLREGDQISGMKVAKILEESVQLQYENEKIEIR